MVTSSQSIYEMRHCQWLLLNIEYKIARKDEKCNKKGAVEMTHLGSPIKSFGNDAPEFASSPHVLSGHPKRATIRIPVMLQFEFSNLPDKSEYFWMQHYFLRCGHFFE